LGLGSLVERVQLSKYFINGLKHTQSTSFQTSQIPTSLSHLHTTAVMKFAAPLLLATSASAHTIFVSLNGGKVGDGVRVPTYDGPINDVSTNDIVCNGGPNPTAKTSTVITVQAGSQATLLWRHTLQSGADDVIDPSHKGPVMAYLKKVTDAKSDTGIGGGWFKVRPPY
jgi:hypothetical protein